MQMRHGQHGRRWQERDSAEERENDVKLTCIIARASSWEERGGGKSSVGGMAFEGLDWHDERFSSCLDEEEEEEEEKEEVEEKAEEEEEDII